MTWTWYDVGYHFEGLAQGEIIFNCSVLEPLNPTATWGSSEVEKEDALPARVIEDNFIILTQSCDLEQDSVQTVVLAPVYSVGRFVGENDDLCRKARQCAATKQITIPEHDEPENEKVFLRLAQECKSVRIEIDRIRKGALPAYHLLNKEPKTGFSYSIVDFHRIYSVPKSYLLELAQSQEQRLRLCPPYREHLAQAFARYFMRVGLPADIREFAE